ncbi:hypothetical protein BDZ89DRAFT_1110061 [Hymenopellis radicata]|nr:hypothetical protein BDZ89DRAFT_1110061 [Hymenopellis radicata]
MRTRSQTRAQQASSSTATTSPQAVPPVTKKTRGKKKAAPKSGSQRKSKVAVTRQTRLDEVLKSQKKPKAVKPSTVASPAKVLQTPTRPSGHKAPTGAPPRNARRRNPPPVQSPIRGSSADTEMMTIDEEDVDEEREVATALTPLNFHPSSSSFQRSTLPANSFSSRIFSAGESSTATFSAMAARPPPDQQRQPVPDYVARRAQTSGLSRQETVPFWVDTEGLGRTPSVAF